MIAETERMRGEPITGAHHEDLSRLLGDPRVAATLGGVPSPARLSAFIEQQERHWERHGFGYWLWRDRETGELAGRGGLSRANVGGRDEVEVGWAVLPARWGEGLGTEIGAASVRLAFEDLGLDDVVAYTLPDNRASRRVMEKLGFGFERDIVHAELPHVLYRLSRHT